VIKSILCVLLQLQMVFGAFTAQLTTTVVLLTLLHLCTTVSRPEHPETVSVPSHNTLVLRCLQARFS
jgi:hypothetical protein